VLDSPKVGNKGHLNDQLSEKKKKKDALYRKRKATGKVVLHEKREMSGMHNSRNHTHTHQTELRQKDPPGKTPLGNSRSDIVCILLANDFKHTYCTVMGQYHTRCPIVL
jgi:hypothetical protein